MSATRLFWLYAMPVTAFCLGTWQVYRLRWKRALITELERRTTQPSIALPAKSVVSQLAPVLYQALLPM